LRDDAGVANSEGTSDSLLSWRQVRHVFVDWRIYMYAGICIGTMGTKKCLMTYLPSIVASLDYSEEEVDLMTMIPYGFSCLSILLGSYSASRRNEHGLHLAFFLCFALLGFALMINLADRVKIATYIGLCIACCGTFSAVPILLSWLTNNVGGNTKRTIAVGMMLGIGQIGGVVEPQVKTDFSSID
jgi:predicted MFS family arabinose efflux permease